jgi:hypothetical protein
MAQRLIDRFIPAGRKKTKRLASAFAIVLLVPTLFVYPATQKNTLSTPLREFLQKEIGLTEPEIESVIAARPVAKLLKRKKGDVAVFGIVKINAPQDFFIEKYRDIVAFEGGPGIQGIGRFHSPPKLSDVVRLQMDNKQLKEIPKCRPGNCSIKLSDRVMQSLREKINWSSPNASRQAQSVIRQAFVDYVANYQKIGDEALSIYNDQDKPQSIRDNFSQLLQNSSPLIQYDPQLATYLTKYPQERPLDTEDIFYWQKAEFGLKPVIRASHVVIHRNQHENYVTYAIASKMLYASHYFRAALELKSVVPDSASPNSKSFYLICLNRSYVDGLTGVRGMLIRGTILERSRKSLDHYLFSVKRKIEAAYISTLSIESARDRVTGTR